MQIRTRLGTQFFLITASILLVALSLIYHQFKVYTEDEFYVLLESKAHMTAQMVLSHENELKPIDPAGSNDYELKRLLNSDNILIYNDLLQLVFAINANTTGFPPEYLNKTLISGKSRSVFKEKQVYSSKVDSSSGKHFVVVAEGTLDDQKLQKLRNIMIITFLIITMATAIGGWFYAGQALRPVSQIVHEVDNILPKNLSKRLIPGPQADELSHLVTTFNNMLDRIQFAFQMQKSFISNISHELKNPLTAIDAQIQMARQKERSPAEYQDIIISIHDDVRDMIDTSDKLLQLAKVHAEGSNIQFSPCRLDETIFQTRDSLLKIHAQYAVHLKIDDMPEMEDNLYVQCNEPLLRSAIFNLLENGCKFSPQSMVEVNIIFQKNGKHIVTFKNESEYISQEELKLIFDPFYRRQKNSQVKGSGVGLSLVQSILLLHKIDIGVQYLEENALIFTLQFPGYQRVEKI